MQCSDIMKRDVKILGAPEKSARAADTMRRISEREARLQ